ncbi:MAG: hypothetical protein SVO01_00335 [Thermotogota bacterium]|nr:hypothetical protein [Thermotogota bacterium]
MNKKAKEETSLVLADNNKEQIRYSIEFAAEASEALKKIVDKCGLSQKFGGNKEYLQFEAWLTVAKFYSASPKIEWTNSILDDNKEIIGYDARAVVLNNEGVIIGAAEASCMRDEPNWTNRLAFQIKSMAQTRAQAKALRSCFAWVVVLAGYNPTPLEEMDGIIITHDNRSSNKKAIALGKKKVWKKLKEYGLDEKQASYVCSSITGKQKSNMWTLEDINKILDPEINLIDLIDIILSRYDMESDIEHFEESSDNSSENIMVEPDDSYHFPNQETIFNLDNTINSEE